LKEKKRKRQLNPKLLDPGSENIFNLKREVDCILSDVIADSYSTDEMEKSAKRLSEMGDRVQPFVARRLKNLTEWGSVERILHFIELLNDCSYAEVLRELLQNKTFRNASLRTRVEVMATLKSYEAAHFHESTGFHNKDKDMAYLLWVKRVLEDFHVREYRAISLIEDFFISHPKGADILDIIRSMTGEKGVPLLTILADCERTETALAAVRCLSKIKDDSAVRALKDIYHHSWRSEIVNAAEKGLRRLMFCGYHIDGAPFSAQSKSIDVHKLFVSPVDAMGSINLCLSMNREKDKVETIFLTLNDELGIIDVFGAKSMSGKDLSVMIDDIKNDAMLVEGDMAYFMKLLNNSLYQSEQHRLLLSPEFHYRKQPLKGYLKPEPFNPQLGLSLLKRLKKDKKRVERGGELLELDEFSGWIISLPAVFHYAEKVSLLKNADQGVKSFKERLIIKDFCREVLVPMAGRLRSRLFSMAHFLLHYSDKPDMAHIAIATAINMGRKEALPFIELPFIKAMAEKSILNCKEVLEDGFDLREYEEELDGLDE